MKKLFADLVQETTATLGTGPMTLNSLPAWVKFSDRFAHLDRVYYSVRDANNWEYALGTYLTGGILARTTILGSLVGGVFTNGGSPIALASGAAIVRAVAPEAFLTALQRVEPFYITNDTQAIAGGSYLMAASAIILTLPVAPELGDRVEVMQAAATIAIPCRVDPGAEKINGVAGQMVIDIPDFSFDVVYVNAAYGWKVNR